MNIALSEKWEYQVFLLKRHGVCPQCDQRGHLDISVRRKAAYHNYLHLSVMCNHSPDHDNCVGCGNTGEIECDECGSIVDCPQCYSISIPKADNIISILSNEVDNN